MKSPRFLAALAMAAVLTTGITTTAHASKGSFTNSSGNAVNGQLPTQEANINDAPNSNGLAAPLNAEGDISLNGTFTKRINTFPTPTQDGHYLRITMPINMDYTFDVDKNVMVSTDMIVTNDSVHATNTQGGASQTNLEYKKVRMTLVDFQKNDNGITTIGPTVKFVEDAAKAEKEVANKDNILLPFQLKVTAQTGSFDNFSIEKIQRKNNQPNGLKTIDISEKSALTLKLEPISGQTIGNKDLIKQNISKTSHNLKLQFEYLEK